MSNRASAKEETTPAPAEGDALVQVEEISGGMPRIFDLPLRVTVCVGGVKLSVQELLDLTPDSILKLDRKIDDPVEIHVGERMLAKGELVEVEDDAGSLGVRLTEIVDTGDDEQ